MTAFEELAATGIQVLAIILLGYGLKRGSAGGLKRRLGPWSVAKLNRSKQKRTIKPEFSCKVRQIISYHRKQRMKLELTSAKMTGDHPWHWFEQHGNSVRTAGLDSLWSSSITVLFGQPYNIHQAAPYVAAV